MSKHENIKQVFEERVEKETYTMLCFEENSKNSMIISSKENFKYDNVCQDLKTSDTLFIFDDHIDFIEFKDVNSSKLSEQKKNKEFIRQLRLKAVESYITFYNFLNENLYIISKDEVSDLNLNYIFVFNKDKFINKPTLLNIFSALQSKWTKHYSRFYNKISFIDNDTFIKKYRI